MRRFLLILALLCCAAGPAGAQEPVYDQAGDGQAFWGPSQQSRGEAYSVRAELVDDFDMVGSITQVGAWGSNSHIGSANFPPPFYGVYVRFYAHGADGKPGELQAEYFRPAGDAGLRQDYVVPSSFRFALEPPFPAQGKHFLSVQVVMDPEWQAHWYWRSSASAAPRGQALWFRDLNAAGAGWTRDFGYAVAGSDLAYTLYGTRVLPVPTLDSLDRENLALAGRLRLAGADFGLSQGDGRVLVDGVTVPISRWSDTAITAYLPDSVPLGPADVQVVTSGGGSRILPISVTPRQAEGRVRWRFQADGYYIQSRPAVAPDGSVYVLDVSGRLYALSADGGVRWILNGSNGPLAQSVAVGPDGSVYVSGWRDVHAFDSEGVKKWESREPGGGQIAWGPAVGPDGNLYAVSSTLQQGIQLNAFSLSPGGELRWHRPNLAADRTPSSGARELVFGPPGQFYFAGRNGIHAVGLDGSLVFSKPGYGQPIVGPDGTVYVTTGSGLTGLGPDGRVMETLGAAGIVPDVGSDGVVYVGRRWSELAALRPDGSVIWTFKQEGVLSAASVSLLNDLVVATGLTSYGQPGFVCGVSTAGEPLWKLLLPMDNGAPIYPMARPAFSPDGGTVYVGMTGHNYAEDVYCYFYAIDTAPDGGPALPGLSVYPRVVTGGSAATGRVRLESPAPPGGKVVTLASAGRSLAQVPAEITVREGAIAATFLIETGSVAGREEVILSATWSGASHTAVLAVAPAGVASLTLDPAMATGGDRVEATVTLNGPAPAGGTEVTLTSSDPEAASVLRSIRVPAGAISATFVVTVHSIRDWVELEITATAFGQSATAELFLLPIGLEDLELVPNSLVGGGDVRGTVSLSGPAPPGGVEVALESSDPALATVPASVRIAAGKRSASFTVTTRPVAEWTTVDIWVVTEDGDELGAWLDLLPDGADSVAVQKAHFSTTRGQLSVEATSNSAGASLQVFDGLTGEPIGTLRRKGRKRFTGVFRSQFRPQVIHVRSSRGGAARREVTGR